MKSPTSQMLFRYWNELRGARLAPTRLEIDPVHFVDILSETFILETGLSGAYTVRLAGTRICEQLGFELRGLDFAELAGPTGARVLEDDLAAISARGQCGVFEIETQAPNGEEVSFEAIVLPLVHTQGMINRYLGAMSILDSKHPAWLGTVPLTPRALVRNELFWPDGLPHAAEEKVEHQAPFHEGHSRVRIVHSDRRHFRVFEGGRDAPIATVPKAPSCAK